MQTQKERVLAHVLDRRPLPGEIIYQAKRALVDGIAAISAGAFFRPEPIGMDALLAPAPGTCTVLGTGAAASPAMAAYANAAFAQMHDYNDGLLASGEAGGSYHPGRILVPVALALAEQTGACGRTLLGALAVGYDLAFGLRWRDTSPPAPPYPDAVAATAMAGHMRGLSGELLWGALGAAEFLAPVKLPRKAIRRARTTWDTRSSPATPLSFPRWPARALSGSDRHLTRSRFPFRRRTAFPMSITSRIRHAG